MVLVARRPIRSTVSVNGNPAFSDRVPPVRQIALKDCNGLVERHACHSKSSLQRPLSQEHAAAPGLNLLTSRPILAGMAKKPEPPPQLIAWSIYKIAAKQVWLGTVEAPDEATAIEKASAEFRVPATKLHAVRQR